MDEATSQALPPTRRMATAKPGPPVRGRTVGGSGSGTGKDAGPGISRARWAGVGLVFAALLAAIGLAIVSPSDGDEPGMSGNEEVVASPSPGPSVLDTRIPAARPEIVIPKDGEVLPEWRIDVEVSIPDEEIPKRLLTLVILREGTEVAKLERPQAGRRVKVTDVGLMPGENVLTAALRGPGGSGPPSEPVTVTQDLNAPVLRITQPQTGVRTLDESIVVAGTSEPGASVTITNEANDLDREVGVSPSGTFEERVPLVLGRNRISVTSEDPAGMERKESVTVIREDGSPALKVSLNPKSVARSELPRPVKVTVEAADPGGEPLQDATVSVYIGGPGWVSAALEGLTDADGRATFQVDVASAGPGSQGSEPTLVVEVVAPDGQSGQETRTITIE